MPFVERLPQRGKLISHCLLHVFIYHHDSLPTLRIRYLEKYKHFRVQCWACQHSSMTSASAPAPSSHSEPWSGHWSQINPFFTHLLYPRILYRRNRRQTQTGIKLKAPYMPGKHSITEPHLQPQESFHSSWGTVGIFNVLAWWIFSNPMTKMKLAGLQAFRPPVPQLICYRLRQVLIISLLYKIRSITIFCIIECD